VILEIYENYLKLLLNKKIPKYNKVIIAKESLELSQLILKNIKSDPLFSSSALQESISDKLFLLKEISLHLSKGRTVDEILPRYLLTSKYASYKNDIYKIKNLELEQEEIDSIIKLLSVENQYYIMQSKLEGIKDFFNKLDNKEFSSIDSIMKTCTSVVEKFYLELVAKTSLDENLKKSNYIDFSDTNSLDIFCNQLKEFYNPKNLISSGWKAMDKKLDGGFEKTRLYMFAGRPGVGKSILLLNLYKNMVNDLNNKNIDNKYVIFITLENLIMENGLRLLCILNDNPTHITKGIITAKNKESSEIIKNSLHNNLSNSHLAYFPPRAFGTGDLFAYIEQLNIKTGKKPYAIFLDYLDIMKLPPDHDALRHQLGAITLGLKTLAVKYQIPVITASQLLKDAYNKDPNLGDIKESSEKIDNSDVIGLIHRDKDTFIISFKKSRGSDEGAVILQLTGDKYLLTEAEMGGYEYYEVNNNQQSETPLFENQTLNNKQNNLNEMPSMIDTTDISIDSEWFSF